MSMRYKGAVLSATAPVTSSSSASGVWTMRQQLQAVGGTGWPFPSANFIGLLRSSSADYCNATVTDTSGNMYLAGRSNSDIELAKYNAVGTIQWQVKLSSGAAELAASVALDSYSNVYVFGYSEASGVRDFELAKYDNNGTLQWQKKLANASTSTGTSIAIDTNNNIYVLGYNNSYVIILAKYNSSGVLQWQKQLGASGVTFYVGSIAVDSTGNVYVVGSSDVTGGSSIELVKYNSSGIVLWQKNLASGADYIDGYGITTDTSGNIYVNGNFYISSAFYMGVVKYDSSGNLLWQRRIRGGGATTTVGNSLAIDSNGYVYSIGYTGASGLIVKYDSSGNIQWQRVLYTSGTTVFTGVSINSAGNIIVSGYSDVSGNVDFVFASLPSDGSKTGAYTVGAYSFTYVASSLTDSAASLSSSNTSFIESTPTYTNSDSTLTASTSSLTSTVATI